MIALNTNILVYVEGVYSWDKTERATDLLAQFDAQNLFVPVQVLGELFNVLVRKTTLGAVAARERITYWMNSMTAIQTFPETVAAAMDISVAHQVPSRDAVILVAAQSAGCQLLLSEDFQHDFTWGGVTVVNPFATEPH